jgi:hypothetical protein
MAAHLSDYFYRMEGEWQIWSESPPQQSDDSLLSTSARLIWAFAANSSNIFAGVFGLRWPQYFLPCGLSNLTGAQTTISVENRQNLQVQAKSSIIQT